MLFTGSTANTSGMLYWRDMNKKLVWAVVIIAALIGGWYWLSNSSKTTSSDSMGTNDSQNQGNMGDSSNNGMAQKPMEDGAEGVVIGANLALGTNVNTKLGTYLIGYNGMTLYTKDGDSASASTCTGGCATTWPPYAVGAEDNVNQLKAGVTGKADTFVRADGTIQMTYKGKPLYFYASDKTSADAKGDGVGGVWHVAKP